ncbi:MAG: zinc-ribbon domain-containing protein [Eubacterium sp.]|jgi:uncharacterized membrane protein|nr:zinc-ribbon domain-containing protein [Eubacterium sp.]
MNKCPQCNADVPDGVNFCPACGCKISGKSENIGEKFKDLNNTDEFTNEFSPDDIENTKGVSILSYLGILFIIPLIMYPNSKFAKFHINQGIVFFIFSVIASALSGILAFIPVIGWISIAVIYLVLLIFMILGIVNSATGRAKELPLIGKFRIVK